MNKGQADGILAAAAELRAAPLNDAREHVRNASGFYMSLTEQEPRAGGGPFGSAAVV
jgi:hypothetical protein